MIAFRTLRAEFRPTLRLAIPLVLAELGWMSMAIVDTMMVGGSPIVRPLWARSAWLQPFHRAGTLRWRLLMDSIRSSRKPSERAAVKTAIDLWLTAFT